MTASTRSRAGVCHGRASPAIPMLPGQKPGSLPQRDQRETYLAPLHEFSGRLTATTNYLAAGLRLSKIESAPAVMLRRHTEILEKAANGRSRLQRSGLPAEGIRDWRTHATIIEVSVIDTGSVWPMSSGS